MLGCPCSPSYHHMCVIAGACKSSICSTLQCCTCFYGFKTTSSLSLPESEAPEKSSMCSTVRGCTGPCARAPHYLDIKMETETILCVSNLEPLARCNFRMYVGKQMQSPGGSGTQALANHHDPSRKTQHVISSAQQPHIHFSRLVTCSQKHSAHSATSENQDTS